ncbi:MAG: CHAT domain-containing protein [Candidatus Eremiobacteraeota bacterium]|nr:CHAT domain-containing protein [Candidatus Eremiobacteraeota bacterium]
MAARVEVLADEAAHSPVAAGRTCAASLLRLERERSRAAFYARWNPQLRIDSIDLGVSSLNAIYTNCEAQLMSGRAKDDATERLAVELFNDDVGRRAFDEISRNGALHIAGVPNGALDRLRSLAERYVDASNARDATSIRARLEGMEHALAVRFPQLAAIMLPQAFSHPSSWQRSLTANEAILIDDISGNALNVWVITPTAIRGVRLSNVLPTLLRRSKTITGIVRHIERSGGARRRVETQERSRYDATVRKLAALLLPQSLSGILAPYRHIFIIPTGILYRISYATLRQNHRYLAQRVDLAYLSSPSLLPLIRRAEQSTRVATSRSWLVAFADPLLSGSTSPNDATRSNGSSLLRLPPLPDTAIEAKRAASDFSPKGSFRILSRAAASDRSLLHLNADGSLRHYRYILFATHGVVAARPNRTRRPYIVLSHPNLTTGSGLVGVSDVMKLRLNARMVMLSTCDSGFSYTSDNEGEAEFGRAFMGAGARSVALTLWQIADLRGSVASGLLFARLAKGEAPAIALRRTQIEMFTHPGRGDPEGGSANVASNPMNWGPYVIFGDGFNSSPAGT